MRNRQHALQLNEEFMIAAHWSEFQLRIQTNVSSVDDHNWCATSYEYRYEGSSLDWFGKQRTAMILDFICEFWLRTASITAAP
jgi:hypothetical protein